jgi:hypothetical protein
MPKRICRVGRVIGGDVKPAFLSSTQKEGIQKAFGPNNHLSEKVWIKVVIVIAICLVVMQSEKKGIPVKKLIKRLTRLEDLLSSIKKDISNDDSCKISIPTRSTQGDDVLHVQEGIRMLNAIEKEYFQLSTSKPWHHHDAMFVLLEHALEALKVTSEWVRREISDPGYGGGLEGLTWVFFVYWLTLIMRESGLPYKVNKATQSSPKSSPFVNFLWELQKYIPKECRRFQHSKDALAQGIVRARRGMNLEVKLRDVFKLPTDCSGAHKQMIDLLLS